MSNQCSEFFDGRNFTQQCSRAGKVERDGKWFCKAHDPVARKEKEYIKKIEREVDSEIQLEKLEYSELAYWYCKKQGLTVSELKGKI